VILHVLNTPADIYADTKTYIFIIFLGIPFALLYNYTASILRAIGDSRTPFAFLAISAVLNIALDIFCIVVLHWGCAGAAIATVFSQAVSGAACALYIVRRYPELAFTAEDRHIDSAVMKELAIMGFPMGLQFSITAIGSMVMQSANNGLGSLYVSALTAASRIKSFAMCPFDAIGAAVSTFASQNDGADKGNRTKTGLSIGLALSVSYGVISGLVLIFYGRELSLLFVSAEEAAILEASNMLLVCSGFFYWTLGILNVCRPTIQSMGFTARAMLAGVLEMVARVIVCTVFVARFGFMAICFADQMAWLVAAAFVLVTAYQMVRAAEGRYYDNLYPLYEHIGLGVPAKHHFTVMQIPAVRAFVASVTPGAL
jgi:Na+-driven multidrug efflux pump